MTKAICRQWRSYWIISLLVISFLFARSVGAQVSTATLSGTVLDTSGAVVSAANVTLTSETNSYSRTALTNQDGFFTFASLPSSTYTLNVTAKGFKSYAEKGIHLDPGDSRELSAITLTVGEASQTVTVTAAPSSVPLDTGTLATTITAAQLELIATEGRDVTELLKTLPGFAINFQKASNTTYDPSIVTPQGASLNQNYISNGTGREMFDAKLDGADITAPGGYQGITINPEMIAETQVMTSNFGADTASGPVVMDSVTKSGTKQFHGSLYAYARTYQLNATDWLAGYLGQSKPADRYIYPGFTFGGPVLIPHTNLNRSRRLTFFIGAEDYAQRNVFAYGSASSALVHALVPTAQMRLGDFSQTQLMNYLGPKYGTSTYNNITQVPTVAKDGTPVTNGQITQIDPGGQALLNLMPLPNQPATTSGGFNYVTQNLVNNDLWELMSRVDYAISSRNYLFARYGIEKSAVGLPQTQYSAPSGSLGGVNTPGGLASKPVDHVGAINLTTQISPELLNQLFASIEYAHSPFVANNPSLLTAAGIGYPYAGAYANGTLGYPEWGDYNYDGLPVAQWPDFSLGPIYGRTQNVSGGDNLSREWGRHSLKSGLYIQREYSAGYYNTFAGYGTNGGINLYYIASNITDVTGLKYHGSANYLANLLEGIIDQYQQQNIAAYARDYFWDVAGYAQDSWRIAPNVTLTYGLRLDHLGLWNTPNSSGIAVFDPSQINNTGLSLPGFVWHGALSSVPTSGNSSYPMFIEPRAGLAWDVGGKGKLVLRGGYGVYRAHDSNNDIQAETVTSQGMLNSTISGSGGATLAGINSLNYPVTKGGSFTTAVAGLTKGDNQQQQTKNYSVSVDYTMPYHLMLEASYVGNNSNYISTGNATAGVALNNVNAIPLGAFYQPDPVTGAPAFPISGTSSISTMTTQQVNDYRPYPRYGQLDVPNHTAWANYNGLQVSLRHNSNRVLLGVNYTFSKALGIVSSNMAVGEGYAAISAVNEAANYAPLPFDRSQIFNAIYAYRFGNLLHDRVMGLLVNGWMLSGITNVQSGANLQTSISATPNFALTGKLGPNGNTSQINVSNSVFLGTPDVALMPTVLCNPKFNLAKKQFVNGACFGLPPIGQNGPSVLPYMHGPAYLDSDLTAEKELKFSESKSLRFRLAAFNFMNHPLTSFTGSFANQYSLNLSNFTSFTPSSAAYQPSSGFGVAAYKMGRRVVELSAKYTF